MSVAGVRWTPIPYLEDARGVLSVLEGALLPFSIKRIFFMHRVPSNAERGGHAHPYTDQVLIAVAGHFRIDVSDGTQWETFLLDDARSGLYLPRLTWTRLLDFSPDCVALAVCSTEYVPSDVIREWPDFLHRVGTDIVRKDKDEEQGW